MGPVLGSDGKGCLEMRICRRGGEQDHGDSRRFILIQNHILGRCRWEEGFIVVATVRTLFGVGGRCAQDRRFALSSRRRIGSETGFLEPAFVRAGRICQGSLIRCNHSIHEYYVSMSFALVCDVVSAMPM